MPEVVGMAALLFNPASVPDIASALERLYEDEELRHNLSEKSIQRAQFFSWSKTAKATLEVIKNVAAEGRE